MKVLSKYLDAVRLGAQYDQKNASNNTFNLVPLYETVQVPGLGATSASLTAFVNDNLSGTYQLVAVAVNFGTTSSSGTLQVEVATGTQATGSGTNQLTGTASLAGTANVVVNGTIIAAPTTISAGSRVNLILAGTLTGLANCCVSLTLRRIS